MTNEIEHPKIFISYAWTSNEYQRKVLSFASRLVKDGIDVKLDKWELKAGNNLHAFMENIDHDKTLDRILILINQEYVNKADLKQGGVGVETQIMSPEVYKNVRQTKILPIIFEKNLDGTIPKPTYLKSTVYFDLSDPEIFEEEYRKLVKTLYGKETHKRPELGTKPIWVDADNEPTDAFRITKFSEIKKILNMPDRANRYRNEINKLRNDILNISFDDTTDYKYAYDELLNTRRDSLSLLSLIPYTPSSIKDIANLLGFLSFEYQQKYTITDIVKRIFLHELFIYLIAICYKNKLFNEIGYLLSRSYESKYATDRLDNFKVLCFHEERVDKALQKHDNNKYKYGVASYWMENIDIDFCTKEEFIFADLLCFNVSLFNNQYYWFPYTYIYGDTYNDSLFYMFSNGLKSKERLKEAAVIFGFDTTDGFTQKFSELSNNQNIMNYASNARYPSCFEEAPNLFQYLSAKELGKLS